jgi:hypothetical protein
MTEAEVIATLVAGRLVDCTQEEYPYVRQHIQGAARHWVDQGQDHRAWVALNEVKRLDLKFGGPR